MGLLTGDVRLSAKDKALGGHEGVEGQDACRIRYVSLLEDWETVPDSTHES